jgi:hypothetical protein
MNLHHRNKAIVGLVLWFFAFVVCMALCVSDGAKTWERDFFSGKGMAAMFWGTVVAQYLFFFWGGAGIWLAPKATRTRSYFLVSFPAFTSC